MGQGHNLDLFGILALVVLMMVLRASAEVDLSTRLQQCSDAQLPEENQKLCYKTTMLPSVYEPLSCSVEERINKTIKLKPCNNASCAQGKIFSPGNLKFKDYRRKRFCYYNVGCPPGELMLYILTNFKLESKQGGVCVDYLYIKNFDTEDIDICGELGVNTDEIYDTRPHNLFVAFKTNSEIEQPGFRIDVICAEPQLGNQFQCTTPNGRGSPLGRRRRSSQETESIPSLSFEKGSRHSSSLDRAGPSSTFDRVGHGDNMRTTSDVRIPEKAFLTYRNHTLTIKLGNRVLREFKGIRVIHFYMAYRGVKSFSGSAPREMFGGGMLKIINQSAYYSTLGIPPNLKPSPAEFRRIRTMLNATAPFFVDEDEDEEGSERAPKPLVKRHATPDGLNREAIQLAEDNIKACNPFLRAAAISYLNILEEEGLYPL